MKSAFSPGRSLWNGLPYFTEKHERFKAFYEQSPDKKSLCYYQYYQLAAAAFDWKPDLIIELGRAYGNSTFVFTEVMNQTGGQVISLCDCAFWQTLVVPQIRHLVDVRWLSHLDARVVGNLATIDLSKEIKLAKRILIFWDAHGFQTAEYVLGFLLPMMKDRECLVLMHDITDRRFYVEDESYQLQRLWRPEIANEGSAEVRLGNFKSSSEQFISILDFCARNQLMLRSADESLRADLSPGQIDQIKEQLQEGFSLEAHWTYFIIDDSVEFEKLHFPFYNREILVLEDGLKKTDRASKDERLAKLELGLRRAQFDYREKLKLALSILFS
jgi:hypothetical protein